MKSVDLYRISQIGKLACTLNMHWQEASNNVEQRVNSILSQMTLDEKISYTGGTLPRILKCLAEKPELQFAPPESTNRARKVISQFKKRLRIFEKNGYNTFKSTCPHPCAGPDGSTTVGSLPLDGRAGSRRQLDPGRS